MVDTPTKQDLEKAREPMDDMSIMPFGKFKGCRLFELKRHYLEWLADSTFVKENYPALADYCELRLEEDY